MKNITVLILAAGKGSRYGGAKQFDNVGYSGEYLFEYSIYDAIQLGITQFVIIASEAYRLELEKYFNTRLPSHISLKCIAQKIEDTPKNVPINRSKPWGTAHAVWSARKVIDGPFITINADDYYGQNSIKAAYNAALTSSEKDSYCLIAFKLNQTLSENGSVSRGICQLKENHLESIEEFTKISIINNVIVNDDSRTQFNGNEYASMNLWVLTPTIFSSIEKQFTSFIDKGDNLANNELFLPSIIQHQIDQKEVEVRVRLSEGDWMGMTYLKDKQLVARKLKSLVESGYYPISLWSSL